ncbi:MAG: HDOD domain-containing protein [Candidatus Kapabacteria bacterium]|nr:HDOD domain-containing protein [Candidatus Kapabacteria bacterium]
MDLKIELEKLIETGNMKLPVLPRVAAKVLSIINDPNVNIHELTNLIQQDQAISTHVLRIANSAAFAPITEIVSIQQAITRLGFRILTEITLSISLQSDIFKSRMYHHEMVMLWKHSLLAGLWAKRVAFHKKYNVEATFLGGLLHEIGKPILINSISDLTSETHTKVDYDTLEEILSQYHIIVSKKLMNEWNLPKLVSSIACDYYDLQNCKANIKEASVVFIANKLTNATLNNESLEEVLLLSEWNNLNYYRDEIEDLILEKDKLLEIMHSMVI